MGQTFEWLAVAACRGIDPALFYPDPERDEVAEVERAAKAVCAGCPVRVECLDYALTRREPEGIWGGLSEAERRRVLRRRQPSGPRTCAVAGCGRKAQRRGWCPAHYARWRSHGDPGPAEVGSRRPAGTPPPPCRLDRCNEPAVGRGLCQLHYWRWRRTGNPGAPRGGAVA